MAFANISLMDVKRDLLISTRECSARGLVHSAKWAAEIASALPWMTETSMQETFQEKIDLDFIKEYDAFTLAKSYFDIKEYERAAHYCQRCQHRKGIFLHYFSLYMAGEKKKRYGMTAIIGPGSNEVRNPELLSLKEDLQKQHDELDGYCLYLLGIVLKELDLYDEAIKTFLEAVEKEPLHWGAWQELASLCKDREMLQNFKIPNHWMAEFFQAQAELDVQMNDECLKRYESISASGFAKSTYVLTQMSLAHYNLRNFEVAIDLFKELHKNDPFMLDHIDTYSNILYIQDSKSDLSYLAHHVCEVDKYRHETCGVIGNYYSLRGDHEKAALYFRQALKLNPQHVVSWTLLGHEYVELKNTSAAIESYRRATEANRKDYRAWYGLGQTYEILKMPYYSLYYYREAQKLRPNDPRMLVALGDTYHYLDKNQEAKKCYWRAFRTGDPEGQATIKLAHLYASSGDEDEAAKLYAVYLDQTDPAGFPTVEGVSKGCVFLARYYMKKRKFDEAEAYARRGTEYIESREEARSLLYEINKSRLGMDTGDLSSCSLGSQGLT